MLDSWDVDSDVEREKAKKEADAKAKAAAAAADAAAKKKSKTERIAEHKADRARRTVEDGSSDDEEETEAEKRARLKQAEKESDLRHAEDLIGDVGISATRKGTTAGTAVVVDASDPNNTVNLTKMPVFNPKTKADFENLRNTLSPVIAELDKRPHYTLFLQEFTKQLAKGLPSEQIKKVASALTTLSNEKMKEEKAADKAGKKSKAQKTKTSLVTNRANAIEVNSYEAETFGDDDFM